MMPGKYNKECTASCLNCDKLNDCRHNYFILHKELSCSDYAKEGCVHYSGSGVQNVRLPVWSFIMRLMKGKAINESEALRRNICGKARFDLTIKIIQEKHELILTEEGYKMKSIPAKKVTKQRLKNK